MQRLAGERGVTKTDWLDSWHTFSFGEYHDPNWTNFGVLRVINQDILAPNTGFGTHPHRDMEILTYVLRGEIHHRDSLGNEGSIRPNELQRMSAGTGIQHSEWNPSATESCELLQIWIFPRAKNLPSGYEQAHFPVARTGEWQLLASPSHEGNALTLQQDAKLFRMRFQDNTTAQYTVAGRKLWLQVVKGSLKVGDTWLTAGDGLGLGNELAFIGQSEGEILLFDLPG